MVRKAAAVDALVLLLAAAWALWTRGASSRNLTFWRARARWRAASARAEWFASGGGGVGGASADNGVASLR